MNDEVNIQEDSSKMFKFLLNPSRVLSQWYFGLGVWILLLGVLNLLAVAHPTQKISWAGFLSLEILGSSFAGDGYHPLSDTAFLCLGLILIGLGSKGLQSEIEGGLSAWIKSLFINNLWPSLLSPEESGWRTTITAWLLLLGFGTYMAWGILYCTWVDVGIYAVCVPIIGFGFSLLFLPDDDDNVPQD